MSTKKRVVSAALAAAVGVSLLCGFGFAKKSMFTSSSRRPNRSRA